MKPQTNISVLPIDKMPLALGARPQRRILTVPMIAGCDRGLCSRRRSLSPQNRHDCTRRKPGSTRNVEPPPSEAGYGPFLAASRSDHGAWAYYVHAALLPRPIDATQPEAIIYEPADGSCTCSAFELHSGRGDLAVKNNNGVLRTRGSVPFVVAAQRRHWSILSSRLGWSDNPTAHSSTGKQPPFSCKVSKNGRAGRKTACQSDVATLSPS